MLKIKEAVLYLRTLGVETSPSGLRYWHARSWLIPTAITPGGQRLYSEELLTRFAQRYGHGQPGSPESDLSAS